MLLRNYVTPEKVLKCLSDTKYGKYISMDAEYFGSIEDNLTGKEINNKIVIRYVGTNIKNDYLWLVLCLNCYKLSVVEHRALMIPRTSGKCKKCISMKHIDSKTIFYSKWKRLVDSFTNENKAIYYTNKLKGISLCQEWLVYENFKNDMYGTYIPGASIKLNKNTTEYSKKNVRWVGGNEEKDSLYF